MPKGRASTERINMLSREIVGACIEVHRSLGPGLLESSYETCLGHELSLRGIAFQRQVAVAVSYKGINLEAGYRLDLLVEGLIVVELKAVDTLMPIHTAQMLTYLRMSGCRLGLLVNFNVPVLKQGIKRVVFNL